mgnify:CR=1 FL=1
MLKTRILTALVLLPLMLAALFLFNGVAWAGFSWLIIVLATIVGAATEPMIPALFDKLLTRTWPIHASLVFSSRELG